MSGGIRHKLLRRQLRRAFGSEVARPALEPLLDAVDQAYQQADADRSLAERALDLTSRELLDRNRQLRAFLDSAPFLMGVVQREGDDLLVMSCNETAASALGIDRGASRVPLRSTRVDPGVARLWVARSEEAHASGGAVRFEYASPRDTGDRWFCATIAPLRNGEGPPTFCCVLEDATERKRLADQLAARERLASLGTLAAGVAHEINNPLTYVLGNITFAVDEIRRALDTGGRPTDRARLDEALRALADARTGAERVRTIVRDLKAHAREPQAGSVTSLDLNAVLAYACDVAADEVAGRARLTRRLAPSMRVDGDETRLGQVFVNLLVNAAQAILPGKPAENEVVVTTGRDDHGRPYVDVTDTGSGISSEALPRIFDPYFTLKPVGVGTGLGLSICDGIVRASGGDIEVLRTEIGVGTTFRVRLAESAAGAPTAVPRHASSLPPRRGRVLVVDDDPAITETIRRTLIRDHDVVVANGGARAIDVITADSSFDLVLCDLRMPDVHGATVYLRAAELCPELASRFVILTGDAGEHGPRLATAHPGLRVLDKPYDPAALKRIAREHVRARESMRKPTLVGE